ncbi:hypothetical protein CEW87_15265 [Parazoarcus communis]|uniref:Uncharacterized protein n=1 Tax=Parazoarcus communis TaxID=41977 RepID=A0A2U8H4Q0_9RHOO|nr:hypothetical protein [Parazoarcus communis]AWI80604.1 hypothetical protein CEW87_15265 [Parazoarcus communis]
MHDTSTSHLDHLQILTVAPVRRRLQVTEYVDTSTGEILTAEEVRKLGVKEIRADARMRRERALAALRDEVRQFAEFVLSFRNGRGAFTPGMDQLCKWYAFMLDRRPDNVRRLIPKLAEGGIVEQTPHGEWVPTKDFMWIRGQTTKGTVHGEYAAALTKFDRIRLRRQAQQEARREAA